MKLFETYSIGDKQYRFPRSKKKRIRKKWSKHKDNWCPIIDKGVFIDSMDTLICHPSLADKIRKKAAEKYLSSPINVYLYG